MLELLEVLSVENGYNEETIKKLDFFLNKYAQHSAKSKCIDSSTRATLRKNIRAIKETIKDKEMKM